MPAIESPCTQTCVIEASSGFCLGCGRSLFEIEYWTGFSDEQRSRIMAELPRRRPPRPASAQAV
jgi:predicted Fe-S protein YdhL (DUF1289 family)